ncbi:MAG: molybdenum cofactor biosynthesis protein MoaE [Bacteroidia bacterium]|nr:molybdenum cofactor biosynthesis protein MoaE [Bacteroidia bacterium]MCO5254975.1 molybdenum cofactor biosynthesis protein MoaE [Bacteroidota bacterium]MCZ2131262.1 molybdenum cofactor biosynthesis protein MoaE [Bacteroidia bacterium]
MHKPKNIFVQGAISPQKIAESISHHSTKIDIGAHSIFLGQVRADIKEMGVVVAIDYTAYEDMAIAKAHEIRESVFAKYELTCMHIYHSLGEVKSGEISLFVFVSSKHRKAAIVACEEVVERVKKDLPVWGREILNNQHSVWKDNSGS